MTPLTQQSSAAEEKKVKYMSYPKLKIQSSWGGGIIGRDKNK